MRQAKYITIRPLVNLRVRNRKTIFLIFLTKTYVLGTQKKCLNETVLLSTKTYAKNMLMKILTILR